MPITINLKSAVFAVSDALDLVGVSDFQHGKRVAMIARETALLLGLSEARLENLVFAGLLHDMGVSSTAEHRRLVSDDPGVDRQAHCERAFHLMQPFAHLSLLANAVRHHHTPWTELPADLGEADAIDSNLILLADRVDTLLLRHGLENPLFHSTDICREISALSGNVLQPEVVDAFLAAASREAFWISLVPRHVQTYLNELELPLWAVTIEFPQFRHVARLISSIVDAKSHFTASHSLGVAQLSRHLGERMGFAPDSLAKMEIAGLMHDIGKLCVPDEIVEKPARLTVAEFSVMERHSFETFQILRHVPGLETVAEWAAFHHEALNGHGYPFRRSASTLEPEARIVAVADVFQALAQVRPYRGAQRLDEISHTLGDFASKGILDPDIVALARDDLDSSFRAATQTI
ncbi:MAG: HD domain-containing protein [Dechloromonas sp.]|uniref:HD domain-containing protein n=1 Tax=Candidatus Dechloromonas phosphorivorans TaxID=2899244 RepID=A0A9D7LQ00_9RHOO|nr:HD domain-containing protein [Candidatus Dechloromonas phosphorivorans]